MQILQDAIGYSERKMEINYFGCAASVIIFSKIFISISSSLLIYKQPTPVLCLPNLFKASACRFRSSPYNDKFALRGEKPIINQSTSLPVAGLLALKFPNPIIELPHILGFSFIAFSITL